MTIGLNINKVIHEKGDQNAQRSLQFSKYLFIFYVGMCAYISAVMSCLKEAETQTWVLSKCSSPLSRLRNPNFLCDVSSIHSTRRRLSSVILTKYGPAHLVALLSGNFQNASSLGSMNSVWENALPLLRRHKAWAGFVLIWFRSIWTCEEL